ncbi:MAG: hybrid sensor histidine kinase/response regulator [Deltaproteobacteria bacterium]|nr:MAG: hybrid sensor histidine kinase/response regulator [Deltaproteobacteria bacterium]
MGDAPAEHGPWYRFAAGGLVVAEDVVLDRERVGSVRILSDLGERDARLKSYVEIVALAFAIAIVAGVLLSSRLQRAISDPILHLVDRARVVTEEKNYAIRATPTGGDELGLLVRTFNEMLTQIQARDTALEGARDEAEAANRTKDEFLAVVSHELRTPLTPILAWIRMLRAGSLDTAATARALDAIDRNAHSQARLVDDLLDVSRIITGKVRLDVQQVELRSLVEAAVESARPAAEAKGIRNQMVIDPGAIVVSGDPQRLQQVFWNLLSNAVKFTPRNGRVQLCLQRVNSHVEIAVSDTGQGIKAAFLPHVFDRFRQAESATTRAHGGLGLGLAIVRHIVELHGGSVRVDSDGDGRGATFTVELPTAAVRTAPREDRVHPAAGAAVPFAPSTVLNGVRVLVVDDDRDTLDTLWMVLKECGAEVRTADGAASALEVLGDWRPDALVSDIGMPGEDGYSLIAKVRALSRDQGGQTPALALTAYARSEDRVRALSAGFQMHMAKPVEPAELVAMVSTLTSWTGPAQRA